MRQGLQNATDHTLGSRREESLRARSGFALQRRAPTAVVGRSQDRQDASGTVLRHVTLIVAVHTVVGRLAGLPVTQCRPWTAEALGARHALRPACLHRGAGKRAERFRAASSWRVIRVVLTTPGASVRLAGVAHPHPYSPRERAERGYERRPFSGSRKRASVGQGRHCVGSRRCPHRTMPTTNHMRRFQSIHSENWECREFSLLRAPRGASASGGRGC